MPKPIINIPGGALASNAIDVRGESLDLPGRDIFEELGITKEDVDQKIMKGTTTSTSTTTTTTTSTTTTVT